MGARLILETSVLVDLEREKARELPGPAHAALARHASSPVHVTFTVVGELAAGTSERARRRWQDLLRPYPVLWCTPEICWRYGQLHRHLRGAGQLIPTNDMWIAATALAHSMAVLTRDGPHYRRVRDLDVVSY